MSGLTLCHVQGSLWHCNLEKLVVIDQYTLQPSIFSYTQSPDLQVSGTLDSFYVTYIENSLLRIVCNQVRLWLDFSLDTASSPHPPTPRSPARRCMVVSVDP